jgi:hypothetical protein
MLLSWLVLVLGLGLSVAALIANSIQCRSSVRARMRGLGLVELYKISAGTHMANTYGHNFTNITSIHV